MRESIKEQNPSNAFLQFIELLNDIFRQQQQPSLFHSPKMCFEKKMLNRVDNFDTKHSFDKIP